MSSAAAVHGADKRALSCGKHPQVPVRSEAASPAASRSGRERGPIYGMEFCLLLCVAWRHPREMERLQRVWCERRLVEAAVESRPCVISSTSSES